MNISPNWPNISQYKVLEAPISEYQVYHAQLKLVLQQQTVEWVLTAENSRNDINVHILVYS